MIHNDFWSAIDPDTNNEWWINILMKLNRKFFMRYSRIHTRATISNKLITFSFLFSLFSGLINVNKLINEIINYSDETEEKAQFVYFNEINFNFNKNSDEKC